MAKQDEAGDISPRLHGQGAELAADLVERGHLIDSALHIGILGNTALLSSGHETNAKRFGRSNSQPGSAASVRLSWSTATWPVTAGPNGFGRVDAVTSGQRDIGPRTGGAAAFEHATGHGRRKFSIGSQHRNGHQRRAAHGVNIANGIHRSDLSEVKNSSTMGSEKSVVLITA